MSTPRYHSPIHNAVAHGSLSAREGACVSQPALGDLEQLFSGSLRLPTQHKIDDLWAELEGLAYAVQVLHNDCMVAHGNIKSSGIEIFEDPKLCRLKLRIADHGLAIDLRHSTADVGSKHRSAEAIERNQSTSVDKWMLGRIFVELATFLLLGGEGIVRFTLAVTAKKAKITTDIAPRVEENEEFLQDALCWLDELAHCSPRADEMRPLVGSMLGNAKSRPDLSSVVDSIQKMSFCAFWDGTRVVEFIRPEEARRLYPVTRADHIKDKIERMLASPVDWWPLSQGHRSCGDDQTRIVWKWCGKELYVDVPKASAREYLEHCDYLSLMPSLDLAPSNATDHGADSQIPKPSRSSVKSSDGHPFGRATDTDFLRAQQRSTDDWFNDFLDLLKELRIGETSEEPLRIAILDSGIDLKDADFNNDERIRIKDVHSFVDDNSTSDTLGHGTFVAAIILRLTVNVDLYIAKITNSERPSKKATVKAMHHARTEWGVNIISLSSGFEEVTPADGLQYEVETCLQHKIIIFASACNDSAEGSRTWPAMFDGVIGVHLSDCQGRSSGFNPLPHDHSDMSFIGEAIRPIWGRRDLKKSSKTSYQSGTSYATPVAVAFGALMIGYVKSRGWKDWEWTYAPWTPIGMVHTLRMMSAPTEAYRWVSPMRFFKHTDADTIEALIKEELVRGRIDEII